jgi:dinuclear metal center YbgI/SA1388 family protein
VLFRPVKRLTADGPEGRALLTLIRAGISVYCPHTAFDSAAAGINQQLADSLGLANVSPLRPLTDGDPRLPIGSGRSGDLPAEESLSELVARVRRVLRIDVAGYVGSPDLAVRRVGVACGAAAEFLDDAARAGCQVLLTGEARFHSCLEARSRGIGLILAGHYATERPAVEALAKVLKRTFPDVETWASHVETDPLCWSIE